jgi:hypothetical protein
MEEVSRWLAEVSLTTNFHMPAVVLLKTGMFLRKVSLQISLYVWLHCPASWDSMDCYSNPLSSAKLREVHQPALSAPHNMMIQNNLRTVANDAFGRLTST